MLLFKKEFDSPIGSLTIICDINNIIRLSFKNDNCGDWLRRYLGDTVIRGENKLCRQCENEILLYLSGRVKSFSLPYKLYGTPFQLKVWNALSTIPYGSTASYAEIARLAGIKGAYAARAAAGALSKNPIPIIVPCHRIIYSDGTIGGYCGGCGSIDIKRALLSIEGAVNPS